MHWDEVSARWSELKEEVRGEWQRLSDKDLDAIAGQEAQLVGTIQKRYRIMFEDAQDEVSEWLDRDDYA